MHVLIYQVDSICEYSSLSLTLGSSQRSTRGSAVSDTNIVVQCSACMGFIKQMLRFVFCLFFPLQRRVLASRLGTCGRSMEHLPASVTNCSNTGISCCIHPAPAGLVWVVASPKTGTSHQQWGQSICSTTPSEVLVLLHKHLPTCWFLWLLKGAPIQTRSAISLKYKCPIFTTQLGAQSFYKVYREQLAPPEGNPEHINTWQLGSYLGSAEFFSDGAHLSL